MTKQEQNQQVYMLIRYYEHDVISGFVPFDIASNQLLGDLIGVFGSSAGDYFDIADFNLMKSDILEIKRLVPFQDQSQQIHNIVKRLENQIIGRNKPND